MDKVIRAHVYCAEGVGSTRSRVRFALPSLSHQLLSGIWIVNVKLGLKYCVELNWLPNLTMLFRIWE